MWILPAALSSNTSICMMEKLSQESFALRVTVARLQNELFQCQREMGNYCTSATELRAELEELHTQARQDVLVPSKYLRGVPWVDGLLERLRVLAVGIEGIYQKTIVSKEGTSASGGLDGTPSRTGSCCQCCHSEERWKGPRCAP